MGASKLEHYSSEDLRNAELGRAVGAPARIVILRYLKEHNIATGNQLTKVLKLAKPTIQQHLEALVLSGLVCGGYFENTFCWQLNKNNPEDFEKINWALIKED